MYSSVNDFRINKVKNPNEAEFHQAVHEVIESVGILLMIIHNISTIQF